MKREIPVEQLLRWRLARAETEAPRSPSGARLLELVRPWWEIWPERFQSLVESLSRIQIAYGHAMTESGRARGGHPVPVIIARVAEELEASARVLYINVRDGRLRLRFQLEVPPSERAEAFEATFIAGEPAQPVLAAQAAASVEDEYRIDSELSAELAREWESLKVTDRMPFRLILRSDKAERSG